MFIKYPHLERYGTDEVDGITIGECHIFPKLDGTNASVWFDPSTSIHRFGSRNRELSVGEDNAGFMNETLRNQKILDLTSAYPGHRFYGEWLVPHSLKTYRDDAWRKFYIFDVVDPEGVFLPYEQYSEILNKYFVDYVPCMSKIMNPSYESLVKLTEENKYLLQEGTGHGEGIVIKQYGWKNRFQRTTWAKLITNTFKEKHVATMGGSEVVLKLLEEDIAEQFISKHDVDKIIAKIKNEHGVFTQKFIPQLLNTTFHELITEEMWEILKKHKNPKIDFKTLYSCSTKRVKKLVPEIF